MNRSAFKKWMLKIKIEKVSYMLNKYTMLWTVLISLLFVGAGAAQNHSVSGTVMDSETGETLPGVNIFVQGTTQGTTSDIDGNYSLSSISSDDILVFSYVGYERFEVAVGGRDEINVEMISEAIMGGELIVVGYGTQNERYVTGSISSVDMEETNAGLANVSLTQSLSGVPGVQFTGDGRPGQSGGLLVRGRTSLSGGNSPLIVLDGIIFNGSLNDLNPQDIATLDILKDASSTAIYGSRAANGVILVTTKEGGSEKPLIRLNVFGGISESANTIKTLSADRYIERRLDWRRQSGLEADPNNIENYFSTTEVENIKNGISYDPWDVASQQGRINSVDLSVSGRSDRLNYYISSSYSEDKGLIYNDKQERFNLRTNVDFNVTDWLDFGTNTIFSNRDLSGNNASVNNIYRSSPLGTFYHSDGEPTQHPVDSERAVQNAMWGPLLSQNEEIYNNIFSTLYAKVGVNVLNGQLSYRANYSPNLRWNHNYNYLSQDVRLNYNNTSARKFDQKEFDWVLENILTYSGLLAENHAFDITLLHSRTHMERESTTSNADILSIDGLGYNNLGLGSIQNISSYAQNVEEISYMGRLNYQFKNRYLFTLTTRRDGSSVFSANNKYATFPSAAIGWIISDEAFMSSIAAIDLLKVRLSYGKVGNQAIGPYQSLSLAQTTRYIFGNGANSELGVVNSSLRNDDLKWETTTTTNLAVDFELLKGRFGGSIELYNSDTNDLLVRRSIPVMNGYSSVLTNIGEVNNRGIEVALNSINLQTNNFSWSSNFNFTYNQNKINHLFGTDLNNDGKEDDSLVNSWFIGQPITSYYDYVFDGIYQEGDSDIPAGSEPGFVRVKDLNGDGVINSQDRKVVTSGGSPKYQLGFTNRFNYKNFELSVFINSMLGWDAPFNLINPLVPGRSINQIDAGWWTSENQSNTRPSLTYSNPLDTNWYMSRNFVRVKDVSFSYQFDTDLLNKLGLSNLRLSLSAKNLYTFTNWLGSDPESGGEYLSEQGNDQLFPMPRTYSIGINIGI